MSQSSVIFFVLFAAFVIFITQKGELPTYLGLLLLSPPSGVAPTFAPQSSQTSQNSTTDQIVGYVENNAATAAKVFLMG